MHHSIPYGIDRNKPRRQRDSTRTRFQIYKWTSPTAKLYKKILFNSHSNFRYNTALLSRICSLYWIFQEVRRPQIVGFDFLFALSFSPVFSIRFISLRPTSIGFLCGHLPEMQLAVTRLALGRIDDPSPTLPVYPLIQYELQPALPQSFAFLTVAMLPCVDSVGENSSGRDRGSVAVSRGCYRVCELLQVPS